ncbi:MAG: FtsX-like permease family protein [Candidatus Binatia bacterium]
MLAAIRLAWRNLWRNRRRTLITTAAVALGTAILIVVHGLTDGLLLSSVLNATDKSLGEVQVHAPGYLGDRSMYKTVDDPQRLLDDLDARDLAAVARSYGYGLVAAGTKSAGARFWGVDPVGERRTFDLADHVSDGRYLAASATGGVVLGRKLARSLNAGVGDEIVAVVQAADGSLGNELFTVTGILLAVGESIDRSAAILHAEDYESLFVSEGRVHEVAINTRGTVDLAHLVTVTEELAPAADVRSWRELMPMLSDMLSMVDGALLIFGSIFFLAAGLGVLNTMLMATYERTREFGIVKALGAAPWRIAREVALEAWMLALFATSLGGGLGLASCALLEKYGIDLSHLGGGLTFAGVALDPVWRARFDPGYAVMPILVMWIVCVLAALYPAVSAARLDPVDAMTHT